MNEEHKLKSGAPGRDSGRRDDRDDGSLNTGSPFKDETVDEFLSAVSHDLRAPLRRLGQFTDILLEEHAGRLDDEGKRIVHVIVNNVKTLERLMEALLALSRLGRQEMRYVDTDMARLAKNAFEELTGGAPAKAPAFNLGELPRAYCDGRLMREVFGRLLDNAVKFSSGAQNPVIEAGGYESGMERVYYIKDNGAGFDMRYAHNLFHIFQRLHAPEEYPGLGSGLAAVKLVVHRHGGRVWAEGTPGAGAVFYFAVPVVPKGETS